MSFSELIHEIKLMETHREPKTCVDFKDIVRILNFKRNDICTISNEAMLGKYGCLSSFINFRRKCATAFLSL